MGALYFLEDKIKGDEEIEVKHFIKNGEWDKHKLLNTILVDMVKHIIEHISPRLMEDVSYNT